MKALNLTMIAGILMSTMCYANAAKLDINALGGSILPIDHRCEVSVNMPVIDYGTQSRWQLQDVAGGQKLTTGKRNFTLNIVCPYAQNMRVVLRGSRSNEGQLRYGDRGSMSLRVLDAQLDGQSVELSSITAEGAVKAGAASSLNLTPDTGMMATRNGQAVKGKTFNARLEVEPMMVEKDARVARPLVSESNFTLELLK